MKLGRSRVLHSLEFGQLSLDYLLDNHLKKLNWQLNMSLVFRGEMKSGGRNLCIFLYRSILTESMKGMTIGRKERSTLNPEIYQHLE